MEEERKDAQQLDRTRSELVARSLYARFKQLIAEGGRFDNFALDPDLFEDPTSLHQQSEENTIKYIADMIDNFPEAATAINTADEEFIQYAKDFLQNALLAHNRPRDISVNDPVVRIRTIGKEDSVSGALGIKGDVPCFTAAIINPKSEAGRKFGTGWVVQNARCYMFSLEDNVSKAFVSKAFVGFGDMDDPDSDYALGANWRRSFMTVPDAILPAAIRNWVWERLDPKERAYKPGYDEVRVLRQIDIEKDAIGWFDTKPSSFQKFVQSWQKRLRNSEKSL